MSKVTIGRWGKNLAVRFPGEIAEATGLADGEKVEIEAIGDDEIVIRRLARRLTAEDMFKGTNPKTWRRAYADAFDWGEDNGREVIE